MTLSPAQSAWISARARRVAEDAMPDRMALQLDAEEYKHCMSMLAAAYERGAREALMQLELLEACKDDSGESAR